MTARYVAFIGDENANCAPAFLKGSSAMKRRRFKQTVSLEDRLVEEATQLRESTPTAEWAEFKGT
jgi:hypothetical protein